MKKATSFKQSKVLNALVESRSKQSDTWLNLTVESIGKSICELNCLHDDITKLIGKTEIKDHPRTHDKEVLLNQNAAQIKETINSLVKCLHLMIEREQIIKERVEVCATPDSRYKDDIPQMRREIDAEISQESSNIKSINDLCQKASSIFYLDHCESNKTVVEEILLHLKKQVSYLSTNYSDYKFCPPEDIKLPYHYFIDIEHISIYDVNTLKLVQKLNHFKTYQLFQRFSKSLMTKSCRLFISGSLLSYDNMQEYLLKENEIVKRKVMLESRYCHGFVELNDNYLVVISGTDTRSCEAYNILEDKWTSIPSLHEKRKWCVALVSGKSIFVHGGIQAAAVESYEVIELDEELKGRWNLISIYNMSFHTPIFDHTYLQMNEDEFLLIGGKSKIFIDSRDSVVLNTKTGKILPAPPSFYLDAKIGRSSTTAAHFQCYYASSAIDNASLLMFNGKKWIQMRWLEDRNPPIC